MLITKAMDWDNFTSSECHRLKALGDFGYIEVTLKQDTIRQYWDDQDHACAFYVLAMIDYLCRIHELPICTNYNDIRCCKLKETVYPADVRLLSEMNPNSTINADAEAASIPEFIRFNIVETDVRAVG